MAQVHATIPEIKSARTSLARTQFTQLRPTPGIAINAITLTVANEDDSSSESDNDDDDEDDSEKSNGGTNGETNAETTTKKNEKQKTREVHLLIETPSSSGGRLAALGKSRSDFLKESFWYTRALPVLSRRHPVLKELFPTCLHGSDRTEGGKRWKVALAELVKSKQGVVIFEDPKMDEFKMIDRVR
jgi:hypothetical protein